jgi:hypothetical protein
VCFIIFTGVRNINFGRILCVLKLFKGQAEVLLSEFAPQKPGNYPGPGLPLIRLLLSLFSFGILWLELENRETNAIGQPQERIETNKIE